jgi:hypothetical protein
MGDQSSEKLCESKRKIEKNRISITNREMLDIKRELIIDLMIFNSE